jgi:hypothetical protein
MYTMASSPVRLLQYEDWSDASPGTIVHPDNFPIQGAPTITHAAAPLVALKDPSLTAMAVPFMISSRIFSPPPG